MATSIKKNLQLMAMDYTNALLASLALTKLQMEDSQKMELPSLVEVRVLAKLFSALIF